MKPHAHSQERTYELHGLRVRSELPMAAPLDGHPADVEVRCGERLIIGVEPPPGRIIAQFVHPGGSGYVLAETAEDYRLRFFSTCEFRIRSDLKAVGVHMDARSTPEIASLLLTGNVMAVMLQLAGKCVLHASAVAFGDAAVVFVGGSGMGKSTMAALLCLTGGRLITDDVLRVDLKPDPPSCYLGTREIRLRSGAEALARRFAADRQAPTADRRLGITMDRHPSTARIHSIVVPQPRPEAAGLALERLAPRDTLLSLVRHPKIQGWRSPAVLQRDFRDAASLARRVPVYRAQIPWGPPFASSVSLDLLRRLGLAEETSGLLGLDP